MSRLSKREATDNGLWRMQAPLFEGVSLVPVSVESEKRALSEADTVVAILAEVMEKLILQPPRRLTVIGVAADHGTVTLHGEVDNQLVRE